MATKRIGIRSRLAVSRAMTTLIEGRYWPESLQPRNTYTRRHDDADGQRGVDQELAISIGHDGDAWVLTHGVSLRFRTHAGGGQSLRVRNALIVLAEAIRRDNEQCPQDGVAVDG